MARVRNINEINLKVLHEDRFVCVPLNNNAVNDPYWKTVGLFKENNISTPATEDLINNSVIPRMKLLRTGKTIINKFAHYIVDCHSINLSVTMDNGKTKKLLILRDPRDDGVGSKEAYVIGVYDPQKEE